MMEAESDKFVTVVAVEAAEEYVTVLSVGGGEQDGEDVLVYRLPGERLGFGLKFEGGTATGERVRRLFIQSCAPDSPASRVTCSWGCLQEGDEVLQIDSMPVNMMTRLDCVRCLKDSNVVLKLRVRHAPPPPVPPRRSKDRPPEPEVYLDLLAQEAAACLTESESDDTGSSISTVVIDIAKVLSPFEQLERELDDEGATPLQPPLNFQDAPLSYGDEKVLPPKPAPRRDVFKSGKKRPPPPPPPRSDRPQCPLNVQTIAVEESDLGDLPRLVDVVPKSETDGEARPPITEGREYTPEGEGTLSLIVGKSSMKGEEGIQIKEEISSFKGRNVSLELKTVQLETESSVESSSKENRTRATELNEIVSFQSKRMEENEPLSLENIYLTMETDEFELIDLKTESTESKLLNTNDSVNSPKSTDSKIPVKQSKDSKLPASGSEITETSKFVDDKNEELISERKELRSESRIPVMKPNKQHSPATTDNTDDNLLETASKVIKVESVENEDKLELIGNLENGANTGIETSEKEVGNIKIKTQIKDCSDVSLISEMSCDRPRVKEISIKEGNKSNCKPLHNNQNVNKNLYPDMSEKERNGFTVVEKEEETESEITQNEEKEPEVEGNKAFNDQVIGNEETRQIITSRKKADSRKAENKETKHVVLGNKGSKPEISESKNIISESPQKEERRSLIAEKRDSMSRIPVLVQEREEFRPAVIGRKEKAYQINENKENGHEFKVNKDIESQVRENKEERSTDSGNQTVRNKITENGETRPVVVGSVETRSKRDENDISKLILAGCSDVSTKVTQYEQDTPTVTERKNLKSKISENEENRPVIVGSVEVKSKTAKNDVNKHVLIERTITGCTLSEKELNRPIVVGSVELKHKRAEENKGSVAGSKQIKSNITENEEIRPMVIGSKDISFKGKEIKESKSAVVSGSETNSKIIENGESKETSSKIIGNEKTLSCKEVKSTLPEEGNNSVITARKEYKHRESQERIRPPVEGNKESKSRIPVSENDKSRLDVVGNKETKSGLSQDADAKYLVTESKEICSRISETEKNKPVSRKEIISKISQIEEERPIALGRRDAESIISEHEQNKPVIVGSKGLESKMKENEESRFAIGNIKNKGSETNGNKCLASQINEISSEVLVKQKEKNHQGNKEVKSPALDDGENRSLMAEKETILFSSNDSDSDEDFVLELPEWGGGSVFQPGVGFRCWGLATIGEDEEDSDSNMVSGLSAVSEEDEDSSAESLPPPGNPKKGLSNGCTPDAQLVTTVMEDTQLRRLPPDGHEFPPSYTEHIPPPPEPVTEVEKPPPPLPASDPPTMIKPPVPLPASDPPTMIKPPVPLPASDPPTMIKPPVPLPASDPPTMIKPPVPLPASDPPTMIKPSVRVTSWRKDEKSECSVRDKIAMFSSASANLDRSSSTGGLFPTPEKSLNLDRSSNSFSQYSVDRSPSFLNNFPVPEKTSNFERSIGSISHFSVPEKSPNLDRSSNSVGHFSVSEKLSNLDLHSSPDKDSTDHSPSSLGMFSSSGNKPSNMERTHSSINVYTVSDPKTSLDRTHSSLDLSFTPGPNYSTLPRKPSTTSSTEGGPRLTRATSFSGPSSLHTRSQSLIDIGRGTMEDMRKASLNALIEQRRRGMSKLRGLVIPEKVSEVATPSPSICDLPEIRSRDSIFVKSSYSPTQTQRPNISATGRWSTGPCVFNTTSNTTTTTTTTNNTAPSIVMPSPPWKASNTNNLPKYSPAFKRKSLTVYGTSTTIKDEPPASLESITSPARSDLSFEYKDSMDDKNSTVGRHNSAEDDSDTDSAVSSSRSSISPPPTPPPPPLQSPLRRTLSSETTASGSSSTASTITCGSSDSNRRVLKAQSVEAINRKNVLSSARYSSGKDIKVGSPLIQRKFDEEERRVAYVTEVIDPEEEKPEPPKPLPAPRRTPMPPKPVQRKSMEVNPEEEADLLSVLMGGRIRRQRSKDNMLSDERRSASVHDIRKTFEAPGRKVNHARVSSLDSTASEDSFTPQYGSVGNLHREQFGSVTSIASSTSLISPQELQVLIDEANQPLDDCDVVVVILHREGSTGSIGITLAGGADYEAKEITVHKVLAGSPADRDGRIQKGDRILSINGRSMKGVTHRESLNILKAPRSEVVLVVSRSRGIQEPNNEDECTVAPQIPRTSRPPRIPEQPAEVITVPSGEERGPPVTVTLTKDGAGLGFSLEGGKESPLGDKPLTIKKIFTGGSAEKNGELCAGDELLNVNGTDVTLLSRIEAWGLMKRLPDGPVNLTVRHRLNK